jgi:threonine dehydrogenase-like Zn-dependent dehydrogenase
MKGVLLDHRGARSGQPGEVSVGAVELVDRAEPAVGPGEVLLAVEACGLCGSDFAACRFDAAGESSFSGPLRLPVILGHELSGTVEAVGPAVTRVRVGELVAVESVLSCWSCDTCLSGFPAQCERAELLGLSRDGGLAEYVCVPQLACFPLDRLLRAGLSRAEAAVVGALLEPMGAAYSALFLGDRPAGPGSSVVIYGLGSLGTLAGALARAAGCCPIVGVERDPPRVEWGVERWFDDVVALDLGAVDAGSAAHEIGRALHGRGADVQLDASGSTESVMATAERLLAPGGRLTVLSRTRRTVPTEVNPWVSAAGAVQGLRGRVDARPYSRLIALFSQGRLRARDLIVRFLPLEAVPSALVEGTGGRPGKTVVLVKSRAPW